LPSELFVVPEFMFVWFEFALFVLLEFSAPRPRAGVFRLVESVGEFEHLDDPLPIPSSASRATA